MNRKLFTLPNELEEKLSKETNQSEVIRRALTEYYKGNNSTNTEQQLDRIEQELVVIRRSINELKQVAGIN